MEGFGLKFFLLIGAIVIVLATVIGMFSSKKSAGAALPLPRPPRSRPQVEERLIVKQASARGASDNEQAATLVNNQKNIVLNGYMLTQERRRTNI